LQNSFTQLFIKNSQLSFFLFSITLTLFSCFLGISIGSIHISLAEITEIFLAKLSLINLNSDLKMYETIIFSLRLPRVMLAAIVGASLACAGAAIQGLLKNPLGDPYILGVSSGASVGAVIVISFGITLPIVTTITLPFVSVIFGFATILLVLMFSKLVDRSLKVETIILTGVIFSSFLGSLVSLMIALSGEELRQIIHWLLGSVAVRGWPYIWAMLPFVFSGLLLILMHAKDLNALSFGEDSAMHLGVNVRRVKYTILGAASLLTGAAVAVSGVIGFVGLIIPHLTRLIVGADHRWLLPISIFNGATFLVLTDLIARTIIAPKELPIGVMTALIGAPVFAYIFFQRREGK
jgi:iron complex transport system permease protein